mmetsp:Transcript_5294/g.10906  ORF Transcript_5294/g.10906 Transcript_5294/m.10906 type:complete len:128 (-) Transcript_5294:140-523(-)
MSSFLRMKSWAKELRKMVGDSSKICLFIVGNKSDLAKRQRAVRRELAIKYAESVGADFLEVSAKTGDCVDDIFVGLTKSMMKKVKPSTKSISSLADATSKMTAQQNQEDPNQIQLKGRPTPHQNQCC